MMMMLVRRLPLAARLTLGAFSLAAVGAGLVVMMAA